MPVQLYHTRVAKKFSEVHPYTMSPPGGLLGGIELTLQSMHKHGTYPAIDGRANTRLKQGEVYEGIERTFGKVWGNKLSESVHKTAIGVGLGVKAGIHDFLLAGHAKGGFDLKHVHHTAIHIEVPGAVLEF